MKRAEEDMSEALKGYVAVADEEGKGAFILGG